MQRSFVLIVFLAISFLQYKGLFTCNSNKQLLQNYLPYRFIDYSDFLIPKSPYSPPGKKPFQFLQFWANSTSKSAELPGLKTLP